MTLTSHTIQRAKRPARTATAPRNQKARSRVTNGAAILSGLVDGAPRSLAATPI